MHNDVDEAIGKSFLGDDSGFRNSKIPWEPSKEEDYKKLFDIYTEYLKYVTAITVRRWQQNAVYMTLGTALASIIILCMRSGVHIGAFIMSLLGIGMSYIWVATLEINLTDLMVKYSILKGIESGMPFCPLKFDYEERKKRGSKAHTRVEKTLVRYFMFFFVALSLVSFGCMIKFGMWPEQLSSCLSFCWTQAC